MEPTLSEPEARPVIHITPLALAKLRLYIMSCPVEISGLGHVEEIEGRRVITDVFLLRQDASSERTELEAQAVLDFLAAHVAGGGDAASLRLWWHSHADVSPGWSTTDEETIEGFGGEYLVSIVGNRRGEFLVRIDVFAPQRTVHQEVELVPVEEAGAVDEEALRAGIAVEVREKVRTFVRLDPSDLAEGATGMREPLEIAVDLWEGWTGPQGSPEDRKATGPASDADGC